MCKKVLSLGHVGCSGKQRWLQVQGIRSGREEAYPATCSPWLAAAGKGLFSAHTRRQLGLRAHRLHTRLRTLPRDGTSPLDPLEATGCHLLTPVEYGEKRFSSHSTTKWYLDWIPCE